MPPATDPIPVRILDNLATSLALIAGGSDYYNTASFAGYGRQIADPQLSGYPATFIGEPGEIGQYAQSEKQVLWHGSWAWDIPVFGVIEHVGDGDTAYRSLSKLAADIYRAVMSDHQRGGLASYTEIMGWTMLGPQESTQGRHWVGVIVRVLFRTRDTEMVTQ